MDSSQPVCPVSVEEYTEAPSKNYKKIHKDMKIF